jgi:hypothetical protein
VSPASASAASQASCLRRCARRRSIASEADSGGLCSLEATIYGTA